MKKWLWQVCQVSILLLPVFPALGELGLVIVMFAVWRDRWQQIIENRFNYGWLALAGWMVVSCAIAHKPTEAWLGLANFLPFFALFVALRLVINSIERLVRVAWLLVLPAMLVVVLGMGQLYLGWQSPELVSQILGWELVAGGIPEGRMSGVFIYANFLAIYLVFTFILSLGLWLYYWQQTKPDKIIILGLTLALVLNSLGLLLANSRNSWLIVGLVCFGFALYLGWYWLIAFFSATLAIVCGASFGSFPGQNYLRQIVPEYIWSRLADRDFSDRPIETLRITQWQYVGSKIQERPLAGWGLRNYTPLYLEHSGYWFGHPHNLFLMLGLEIGVVATIFFCLLVGYLLAKTVYIWFVASPKDSLLVEQSRTSMLQQAQYKTTLRANRLIIFTYLMAFASCIVFNLFDVTIFDLRVNTVSWLILAAIAGNSQLASQSSQLNS